jgi:hypothetical protein
MKYVTLVLLAVILMSSLLMVSCRCINRAAQQSDSQQDASPTQQQIPDTITSASSTQQQSPDASSGSNTATGLKADLRLLKGVIGEDGVDITVEYSVNQRARLTLSVQYPDNSTKELNTNRIFEPGKNQTVVHVDPDKGKGQGTIKLSAEGLNGDKDVASVKYVIKSFTPNTNVLWGDYDWVLPSH